MFFIALVLSLLSLLSFTSAQTSTNDTSSAIFVYEGYENTRLVFALNAVRSSEDLYFHLESPAGNSWVGVGIGSQMKGSLMLIAYPSSDGKSVTLSPRLASGHTEPTYQDDIPVQTLNSGIVGSGNNKKMLVEAVCKGCAIGKGPTIDFSSKAQPFIFAVGPPFPGMASDSKSAGLSRHEFYGHFTMDMTAATSPSEGSVPPSPYVSKDASQATNTEFDRFPAPRIHGLVMGVVFILLFPLSSLLLRVWNKVKGHMIVNYIALVLFCMAFAGGAVVSKLFNRSKNFNSAHQIIGIFLLIAIFTQLGLGIAHHAIFKKEQRKTVMGKIHVGLGPAIVVVGIINGAIGFSLAGAPILTIPYVIIVLLFAAIYSCVRGGTWIVRRRRNANKEGPEGYQYPQFGNTVPAYTPPQGPPPAYPPPYSRDVPLERLASSQNVPRVDDEPVQPRPMV